jgi:N-acetyl sugar amidotransferase
MNSEFVGQTVCKNCLMDTSDPDIIFNDEGICNHCLRYQNDLNKRTINSADELFKLVSKIKKSGRGNKYDCVIGLSGGVDSSYVAYYLKIVLNLNPIAVHLDNGWNTALAVRNIKKIVDALNIDLYTKVLDWDSFRKIQLTFFCSNLPDIEVPTDHFINAQLYKIASQYNIKYIINGMNFATESIAVPSWSYGHSDWYYINSVYKSFNGTSLNKDFPRFTLPDLFYYFYVRRIKVVSILNYLNYNKNEALNILVKEFDYIPYSGKHNESFITKFLQDYILPKKFGFDKRKIHLSDLIYSKTITREKAIEQINIPIKISENEINFFCKKLEISRSLFDQIITNKISFSHKMYPNTSHLIFNLKKVYNIMRLTGIARK